MDQNQQNAWGPLAGVTVVDQTQMLSGPFATMILADLGATVIKVETPRGDPTRDFEPFLTDDDSFGGYFHSVNRNKKSVVLDLKSEVGEEAFLKLVSEADVLVENFRVGTMERLGFSYEDLKTLNPGLIYAAIRGFGDPRSGESPYYDQPMYDMIAQAMGGVMSITGREESGPVKVGAGIGDTVPALFAVVGILSALHRREQTGEGQMVDVSMVDAILSLTERIVYQHSFSGDVPGPQGNTHPFFFPFNQFEAKDGYVVITAPTNKHWRYLCKHMGQAQLADEYPENEHRIANREELHEQIEAWTRERTKDDIFDLLAEDVPVGPVYTIEDIFEDPHFETREMLSSVQHPPSNEEVEIAGVPIKLSATPGKVQHRAPMLGEHTQGILEEFGVSPDTIDTMESDG